MNISDLLHRALRLEWLTPEEGVFLFENAATAELMHVGNALRQHHVPGGVVTWIIDRNSNTTNYPGSPGDWAPHGGRLAARPSPGRSHGLMHAGPRDLLLGAQQAA